ncbi:hypothetical protein DPMN_075164 [Dreissena polymorpha]|uniref:Uncharacterized protein n=1 Tax=Dreissena polymorpha TaxID=45954 RepID=A0A9D3YJX0_DREPO|nr:hypothetical protein DPMN_075164 [Dreissena polymorpha]
MVLLEKWIELVIILACMRKLVLIQFPIFAWKVVEGWRREVTARGPDYGYEKQGLNGT